MLEACRSGLKGDGVSGWLVISHSQIVFVLVSLCVDSVTSTASS